MLPQSLSSAYPERNSSVVIERQTLETKDWREMLFQLCPMQNKKLYLIYKNKHETTSNINVKYSC